MYTRYVDNGDCFWIPGLTPHMVYIMSGNWDECHIRILKERPDFQPRFSDHEPDDMWDVEVVADGIFNVHDCLTKQTAGIFRVSDKTIWILVSNTDSEYNPNEFSSFGLLTQLIPYRLVHNDAFEIFLQRIGVKTDQQIHLMLHPVSFLKRQRFDHLDESISKISANQPIVAKARYSQTGKHVFDIVYSIEHLSKLFESDSLGAEKTIIRTILQGMLDQSSQLTHTKPDEFLEQIFADAEAAFNFMSVNHELLLPTSMRGNYPKTQSSDTLMMQRQTAEFLSNEAIQPGTHTGESAKRILDKMVDFLRRKLIQKLNLYNVENILAYAVHIDGSLLESRTITVEEAKRNLIRIKEFDPQERYHQESLEISALSVAVRFVVEMIIQINPNGNSFLSGEKWLEIQALSQELVNAVKERNTIYFRTGEFTIDIDDRYTFQIKDTDIDALVKHSRNLNEEGISRMRALSTQSSQLDERDAFYAVVDLAFCDEFHVRFQDFLRILRCCMQMPIREKKHTIIVDHARLISYIKSECPQLSRETIIHGLELASLTNEHLKGIEIYPTDLRNRKMRSMVKPIPTFEKNDDKMYVINSWRIDTSRKRWLSDMDVGHLPFAESSKGKENINSTKLKEKLAELKQKTAKLHEKNVKNMIQQKTRYCYSKIKPNAKCFSEITESLPGEIDNLSIYPDSKKIVIIEAKNRYLNLSSEEISGEITKYTKKDGFIDKLLKKHQYINKYLRNILEYYDIDSFDEEWQIESYFVTSNIAFPIQLPDEIKSMRLDELEKQFW